MILHNWSKISDELFCVMIFMVDSNDLLINRENWSNIFSTDFHGFGLNRFRKFFFRNFIWTNLHVPSKEFKWFLFLGAWGNQTKQFARVHFSSCELFYRTSHNFVKVFLGDRRKNTEKMIDINTVSPPKFVWFNLGHIQISQNLITLKLYS